ncbi:hypothetical protein GCM10025875_34790 [Litorihabitans aurantiacus]|uniref:VWFA domain-containing protein n=2 Tax=Litorihabitans aurantiacus TaxID=1930061 RepID=A0AA37USN2_9MICO|nr:hypothetical protein GCM10025875_00340 [Litorihabitans aurantiacus]GMA33487.1 hypothetical protein GCM10025875_34790 [Litorihabitans aurantiacus]
MSVPVPPAGSAVISVRVGGDRQPDTSVAGLPGVTLALFGAGTPNAGSLTAPTQGTPGPAYDPSWAWSRCTSDADGDCNFVIPIRPGAPSATGVPQDTRFWVQQVGASPANYYSNPTVRLGGFLATPEFAWGYRFRTGTELRAGATYRSTDPLLPDASWTDANEGDRGFMRNRTDASAEGQERSNIGRTTGVWSQSRVNPTPARQCGIDVAVVTDTSGSLGPGGIADAKAAMDAFVDGFRGTPTRMSFFSFSTTSPGTLASNHPAPLRVTTEAEAATAKAQYAGWQSQGGTNWGRGFFEAASAATDYDLVVLLTDGNPTMVGPNPPSSSSTYNSYQDIDGGIASANAVKATGAMVLAVGVGPGLTANSELNLRAISGTTRGTDYLRFSDFDQAAAALEALAQGDCQGSIEVRKMIVPQGGTIDQATPAPAGWEFTGSSTAPGTQVTDPTTVTTQEGGDGRVTFGLNFVSPADSGAVQILETQQPGYELVPVDGANAVCLDESGAQVPVTNAGTATTPGFSVVGARDVQVSCTVYNLLTPAPGFEVTKTADPASGTSVRGGDTITYTVTGSNTGNTTLDPVSLTDDLSGVLEHATITAGPTASAGAAPVLTGTSLAWNGTLAPGTSVSLTYTVTLDDDVAPGTVVANVAQGSGTPPVGPRSRRHRSRPSTRSPASSSRRPRARRPARPSRRATPSPTP